MVVDPTAASAMTDDHGGRPFLIKRAGQKTKKYSDPLHRLGIRFFPFVVSTFGVLEDQALAFLKLMINHLAGENRSRAARLWREFYLCLGATTLLGNARSYLRWINHDQRGGFGGILVPPARWMIAMDWDEFI